MICCCSAHCQDLRLHLDGSVEVAVHTTGYVQSSWYNRCAQQHSLRTYVTHSDLTTATRPLESEVKSRPHSCACAAHKPLTYFIG
jgi:hypothetical protein